MIQGKVSVSQHEREESGTKGRGQNWMSEVMQRKRRESGSGRGVEQYEGTKQDDLIREYEGWQSYKVRRSLMGKARQKYDVRGVYKANQTNVFC